MAARRRKYPPNAVIDTYDADDPRRVALKASLPACARGGSGFDFHTANINLLEAYYPFLDDDAQARARRTIAHLARQV